MWTKPKMRKTTGIEIHQRNQVGNFINQSNQITVSKTNRIISEERLPKTPPRPTHKVAANLSISLNSCCLTFGLHNLLQPLLAFRPAPYCKPCLT